MKIRIMVMIVILFGSGLQATTYYIGPNGSDSNNGLSESKAWRNFSTAISAIQAGDVLILLNGTYNQSISISKSGVSNSYITIRAQNDGQAIVDGQNSRVPITINGNYIEIEGIVFRNSNGNIVNVFGEHNIVRRCSAIDANPYGNNHRFCITNNYNLIEDCSAGGTGRYCYLVYGCHHVTLRRCFGKWGGHNSGSPRAVFAPYGARDILFENCIATDVYPYPRFSTDNVFYGIYQEMNSYSPLQTDNIRYLGCIIYNNLSGGICISNASGPNIEFTNCVFFDHDRTHPDQQWGTGDGIAATGTHSNMTIKNCTFVNHRLTAVWYSGTDAVTNCIFKDNHLVFLTSKNNRHQYCCFSGNEMIGGDFNSTDIQLDPQFNNSSYVYVSENSPCKNAGSGGEDIGANVLFAYNDGQLTSTPLWPWPMNDRILTELDYDVTSVLYSGDYEQSIMRASASANETSGIVPLEVQFNGVATGGTQPYEFEWDFGDGSGSNEQNPTHLYSIPGNYQVSFSVTDNDNRQAIDLLSINVADSLNTKFITDIKFTLPDEANEITQLIQDEWYDMYLMFRESGLLQRISFSDVWLNSTSNTSGTISNRGGNFSASSSYIFSCSIISDEIWVKQREGTEEWTNVTNSLGSYVDDDNDEYTQNDQEGWVKVKFKLLEGIESGEWEINAYTKNLEGINSSLFTKTFTVLTTDNKAPIPPQNVSAQSVNY